MTEQKHAGGRPLLFDSVEDLQVRINQYFDDCDTELDTRVFSHDEIVADAKKGQTCCGCGKPERSRGCLLVSGSLKKRRPYTVTGLALWLNTSRQTLLNYEMRPEFFDTIAEAKQRIENFAEERLFDPDAPTNGVKFSLSNNYDGWADKRATDFTVKKDSAAELAKRVFDEDDEEEETSIDALDPESSTPTASESQVAAEET